LHGWNTNVTAILSMLRLGHGKLNIDGHYNQICECGAIKTEVHIFLECPSTYTSRQPILHMSFHLYFDNSFECWSQIFLRFLLKKMYFPTLNLLPKSHWTNQNTSLWTSWTIKKKRPYACLSRIVCFCQSQWRTQKIFMGGFQSAKILLCTKIESMIRKNIKQAAIQYVNVVKQL